MKQLGHNNCALGLEDLNTRLRTGISRLSEVDMDYVLGVIQGLRFAQRGGKTEEWPEVAKGPRETGNARVLRG